MAIISFKVLFNNLYLHANLYSLYIKKKTLTAASIELIIFIT